MALFLQDAVAVARQRREVVSVGLAPMVRQRREARAMNFTVLKRKETCDWKVRRFGSGNLQRLKKVRTSRRKWDLDVLPAE